MIPRRKFLRAAALLPLSFHAPPAVAAARRPLIRVWYGDEQTFGRLGNPQRWVNILGNVTPAEQVKSLSYTLNAGTPSSLTIGGDLRRLARAGDFNIELERASLREGRNDVRIIALDAAGDRREHTVTVNYIAGRVWPLPYAIDWSKVSRINDVVEVVDGLWRLESDGVRTAQPYYDRVLAIGDMRWRDYEIETSVVYHQFMATEGQPAKQPPFAGSGAVGILLRWDGHHGDGKQPRAKWNPMGALATTRSRVGPEGNTWQWHGGESSILARQAQAPRVELGRRYRIKARVETLPGPETLYSVKSWDAAQPEPSEWSLVATDGPKDYQSGSLLLIVHHSDVTIGNVRVVPLAADHSR